MSDDTSQSVSKSRKVRLPPPSLLLLGMLLMCAVTFARWYSLRFQRQLVLIQYVESLGGSIEMVAVEPSWARDLLVEQVGADRVRGFDHVVTVDLTLAHVDDEGLENLCGLSQLQRLDLCFTPISSDGLEHLSGLTSLTSLDLRITRVDDEGLEHLRRLKDLDELWLCDTLVSDEAVDDLRNELPDCRIHNTPPPFSIPY